MRLTNEQAQIVINALYAARKDAGQQFAEASARGDHAAQTSWQVARERITATLCHVIDHHGE